MSAMSLRFPPQKGQVRTSISKTRFRSSASTPRPSRGAEAAARGGRRGWRIELASARELLVGTTQHVRLLRRGDQVRQLPAARVAFLFGWPV
jgi:hypothetical protein